MIGIRLLMAVWLAGLSLNGAEQRRTKNIILVTADGLRWQDLFGGMDPKLKDEPRAGMKEAQLLRDKLWAASPEERRRALMPFFWSTLVPKGVVLGNLEKNSSVRVSNGFRVSYPGYSEILTGRAQDDVIRGNDKIQNPTPTIMEFLRQKLSLSKSQVALFGSWETFRSIAESRPESIFINAGYDRPADFISPRLRELSQVQFDALTPWGSVRHDYVTFEMAFEYLKKASPRFLYIALGETDDWAHDRRYDRVLGSIGYFDHCLQELWKWVQQSPKYKDTTTLVITSDHGRGATLEDWSSHGAKVPGSNQIWVAIVGPDTPFHGEAVGVPDALQRDVAPTILHLLGMDYRDYSGVQGNPISLATSPATH